MNIPKFSVKRPVTTMMAMLLVILLGVVSLTHLKLSLMPNMSPPILAVTASYPGATPSEVAENVTKVLEDQVGTTPGLRSMQSRSSENSALIIAEFNWDANLSEVREELDMRLGMVRLPDGAEKPTIMKFDPTTMPIIQFTVTNEKGLSENERLVKEKLLPALQNVNGVANATYSGGKQEEIQITIDVEKLDEYGLTEQNVIGVIQGNQLSYPGGVIEGARKKLNLTIVGKAKDIKELRAFPVAMNRANGEIVKLEDIATVKKVAIESTAIARINKEGSILVNIQQEGDANTVDVAKLVREKVEEFQNTYEGTDVYIATDQGEMIQSSVNNVTKALIFGGIFAVLVIFAFLRRFAPTMIIAIAIPFSVVATFVLMYFNDISLNIISLGGLALGVGMLVDNAIVVIENIYRHRGLGKTAREASIDGAQEVASAVVASTLTTVAVFLPIVFIGDFIGELFKELALSVTFSLLASLVVSLTVIPMLASFWLKKDVAAGKNPKLYIRTLKWSLRRPITVIVVSVLLLVASLAFVPKIGTELMPTADEGVFTGTLTLENGTKLSETMKVVEKIEDIAVKEEGIDRLTVQIGNGDPMQAAMMGSSENEASFIFTLKEDARPTKEYMERVREDIMENVKIEGDLSFKESNMMEAMMGASNEIEVLLLGTNEKETKQYAKKLEEKFKDLKGIKEVRNSETEGKSEFAFVVNRDEALKNGLTTATIGQFLQQKIRGTVVTTLSDKDVQYDVRVQTNESIKSKDDVESLEIPTAAGERISLGEIGKVTEEKKPVTIVRENGQSAVTLSVQFGDENFGEMAMKVQKTINQFTKSEKLDTNVYEIKLAGGSEMMEDSFRSLTLSIILAIIFVYMVLASQFESLRLPLILMGSLPLSIIGVVLALLLTNYAFGITAFIGIIILVGIVVNNAIVFIDYANQQREKGASVEEALIQAGSNRLRPIFMTALTTLLGLLPLALGIGEGSEIQAPMAIAVIGGLLTSTLLTLLVIPVLYKLVEGRKKKEKTVS